MICTSYGRFKFNITCSAEMKHCHVCTQLFTHSGVLSVFMTDNTRTHRLTYARTRKQGGGAHEQQTVRVQHSCARSPASLGSTARQLTTRLAVLVPSVSIMSMTRATMVGPYLSTNLGHCAEEPGREALQKAHGARARATAVSTCRDTAPGGG